MLIRMQTKRLATELLIPTVLLTLVVIPALAVGRLLGLSGGAQTVTFIVIGSIFVCIEEALMSRLARRFGLPQPRQIGKRHRS